MTRELGPVLDELRRLAPSELAVTEVRRALPPYATIQLSPVDLRVQMCVPPFASTM
jgi:hypothetical protein